MKLLIANLALLIGVFCGTTYAQDTTQWQGFYTPHYRNIKALYPLNSGRIVAVGGWEQNDSLTTILISDDQGANWNIIQDNINAIIQDVHFIDDQIGFAVGWSGTFMKTTDGGSSWTTQNLPSLLSSIHFNSCYFQSAQVGFLVGGKQTNDSIQTILRTTDGGQNWTVIRNNQGGWIEDITFYDSSHGIAVGEHGVVLSTSDGGLNWFQAILPGTVALRNFRSVSYADQNTLIAVGGQTANDSIQTIIKSSNAGQTWSVISDQIGSEFYDIQFINTTKAHVVGDDGVVFVTNNSGDSWTSMYINDAMGIKLNCVHFKNPFEGWIAGNYGRILKYEDTNTHIPVGILDSIVLKTASNAVVLHGEVNVFGLNTTLELEYGTTLAFGNSTYMGPTPLSVTSSTLTSSQLSNLLLNQTYFCRIKMVNALGTFYSNTISFPVVANDIPNYNFEYWDTLQNEALDVWFTNGSVSSIPSINSSLAVLITGSPSNEPGAIVYGLPTQTGLAGGIPYTLIPDTLQALVNYNIQPNDTGLIVLQLKNNGQVVYDTIINLYGNNGSQFVLTKWPIWVPPSVTVIDSIFLGFTSSNVFGGFMDMNSYLKIDDVGFSNQNQPMPNADMENWTIQSRIKASSWVSRDDVQGNTNNMVHLITNAQSGSYAIKLSNIPGQEYGRLRSGTQLNNFNPAFPVNYRAEKLYGYYQFNPGANDTLVVRVAMFLSGNQIGYGEYRIGNPNSNYELITAPIVYFQAGTPDSCLIECVIQNDSQSIPSNAFVLLDNFSFDAIYVPIQELGINVPDATELSIYPNPTHDKITIEHITQPLLIFISDYTGKEIERIHTQDTEITIDLSDQPTGVYYIHASPSIKPIKLIKL